MTDLEEALRVAHECADEAATIALGGLGRARSIGRKQSSSDLVTEFDLAVERAVVARLGVAFPDHVLVGEEGAPELRGAHRSSPSAGAAVAREATWYVDPIDGTTNFAHGLPFFATSIGLVDSQGPAVGIVSAPALGWRFSAVRGQGAFFDDRGTTRALRVSTTAALSDALLATGFPYDLRTSAVDNVAAFAQLQRDAQAVRRVGAASLDLAMTAAGWLDGYWERKLKPWDVAAGLLLVTEAGGRTTGFSGGPVRLDSGDASRGTDSPSGRDEVEVVATNGEIHEALLAALARVDSR